VKKAIQVLVLILNHMIDFSHRRVRLSNLSARAAAVATKHVATALPVSDSAQEACLGVAVDVLEVLVRCVEHGDLVIEREVFELVHVPHELYENLQMGGVGLTPVLEMGERTPKADPESLFQRIAVLIDVMTVAAATAADLEAVVSEEVHTPMQDRLDVLVPCAALFALGSAPVLSRSDQSQALVAADDDAPSGLRLTSTNWLSGSVRSRTLIRINTS
jgi:hypothetical protein